MPIRIFNTFNVPSAPGTTEAWGVNDTDQIVGDYDNNSRFRFAVGTSLHHHYVRI
jgi:hypothetical protein